MKDKIDVAIAQAGIAMVFVGITIFLFGEFISGLALGVLGYGLSISFGNH